MTDDANGTAGATQSDADAGTGDSRDVGQRTGHGNENGAAAAEEAEKDRIARGTGVREQIARG